MQAVYTLARDRLLVLPYVARVFPAVERELCFWRSLAARIEDKELRKQALASIANKRFHCQGGSVYTLYDCSNRQALLSFIFPFLTANTKNYILK